MKCLKTKPTPFVEDHGLSIISEIDQTFTSTFFYHHFVLFKLPSPPKEVGIIVRNHP
jgi:hypothetical protein